MLPYLLGGALLGGGLYGLSQTGGGSQNVTTPGYNPGAVPVVPPSGALTLANQVGRRDGVLMATPKPAQSRINPYNSALGQAMLNADKGAPAMMGGYFQGLEAGRVNQFNADNQAYQDTLASLATLVEAQGEQTPPKDAAYTLAGLNSLDRAIQMIDANPSLTTGLGGAILSNIPGTDARDVKALITTVTSQVGFDRLQKMRDESPTGGALGQVSERELSQLNASLSNLEQSQSYNQLRENLNIVRTSLVRTIQAVNAERQMYNMINGTNLPLVQIPGTPSTTPKGSGPGGSTNLPQNNNAGGQSNTNPNPNASGSGGGGGNVVGQTQSGVNVIKVK